MSAEDSKTVEQLIRKVSFFQLPSDDDVFGHDGDEWIIEGVSQGKYHVVVRWCADSYDPEKRKLTAFLALCKFLLDKAALFRETKE